jgi:hypothetical protein|tara:strand:- start:712 stop:870 length:159 start_codon:yes stop_codon:yes gene_type:complete
MNSDDVLKLLEKHEKECHLRYSKIEKSLEKLDVRLWAIVVLIIIASGFEQLL